MHTFKVSSLENSVVLIDAPKLECIYIFDSEDYRVTNYSFSNLPFLIEAHISSFGSVAQLITCFSSAKILTLSLESVLVCSNSFRTFIRLFQV